MINFHDYTNENKTEHNLKWNIPFVYLNQFFWLTDWLTDWQDVYENIEECNLGKKHKVLIVFDMIADIINNKNVNPVVTELFIRGRKLNISIAFIKQSYFRVPKQVRINSTQVFIMKTPNKRELQQIALNHLWDIDFKGFMKIYKNVLQKSVLFG